MKVLQPPMKHVVLTVSGDGLLRGTLPFFFAIPAPCSMHNLSTRAGSLAVLGTSATVTGTPALVLSEARAVFGMQGVLLVGWLKWDVALRDVKTGSHLSDSLQEKNSGVEVSSWEDAHLLQTSMFPSKQIFRWITAAVSGHDQKTWRNSLRQPESGLWIGLERKAESLALAPNLVQSWYREPKGLVFELSARPGEINSGAGASGKAASKYEPNREAVPSPCQKMLYYYPSAVWLDASKNGTQLLEAMFIQSSRYESNRCGYFNV